MKLRDYIRGKRKGSDARRIELDALNDPFLGEALEGYDAVGGDHDAALDRLSARLAARAGAGVAGPSQSLRIPRRKPLWRRPGLWASVASLAIVFGISVVFYRNFMSEKPQMAYDHQPVMEEAIVVPQIHPDLAEKSIPEPAVPVVVPEVVYIVSDNVQISSAITFEDFSEDIAILSPVEKVESSLHVESMVMDAVEIEESDSSMEWEDGQADEEVVVIAYGTQRKNTRIGNAAVVSDDVRSRSKRDKAVDRTPQQEATEFIATAPAPASPFGLNQQGETYRKIQGLINEAKKPAPEDVNTGEMVNYFYYAYEKPAGNEAVNINYEIGECPWNPASKLVIVTAASQSDAGKTNARNLELNVSFNPANVSSYRLVGLEDNVSAQGEESVLALYEVVPAEGSDTVGNIMNLDLSYKHRGSRKTQSVRRDVRLTGIPPSDNFWFASAVAMFGEILKGSVIAGEAGYDVVIENASRGITPENAGPRKEFIRLVETAKELSR